MTSVRVIFALVAGIGFEISLVTNVLSVAGKPWFLNGFVLIAIFCIAIGMSFIAAYVAKGYWSSEIDFDELDFLSRSVRGIAIILFCYGVSSCIWIDSKIGNVVSNEIDGKYFVTKKNKLPEPIEFGEFYRIRNLEIQKGSGILISLFYIQCAVFWSKRRVKNFQN